MGLIKEQRGFDQWMLGLRLLKFVEKRKLGENKFVCKKP